MFLQSEISNKLINKYLMMSYESYFQVKSSEILKYQRRRRELCSWCFNTSYKYNNRITCNYWHSNTFSFSNWNFFIFNYLIIYNILYQLY